MLKSNGNICAVCSSPACVGFETDVEQTGPKNKYWKTDFDSVVVGESWFLLPQDWPE